MTAASVSSLMLISSGLSMVPLGVPAAFADSVTNSGTFSTVAGTGVVWANPTRASTSNNSYATATLNSGANRDSNGLQGVGFGFSIPSNATIDGIEVNVERSATTANVIRTESIQLLKAGVAAGTPFDGSGDPYNWPVSDGVVVYGGATNTWGTTWSPSDVNNANFGLIFKARHSSGGANADARIDQITIKVYYSLPTVTITPATGGSASVPQRSEERTLLSRDRFSLRMIRVKSRPAPSS